MTISTEVRKAGPFIGNGSASSFPFAFKVFKASDLIVVRRQDNIGVETTLVLDSDYHVTLNVNQDTTPGGVVALTGGALADGFTLIVSSELPYLQTTDLTNQGGFYPKVITNALDRLTIFCQQLAENLGRTLKLPITAPTNISTEIPLPNPSELIAWNETGTGLTTVSPQSLVTSIAYGTATADLFAGDGVTTTFPLTTNPASVNNLDVSIGGYSQRPVQDGVGDYSWNGGASITFVTPPPAPTSPGDKNVLVRYMQAIPVSDSEALHAQTREALRRGYAEAGYNLVDGSFETGGTLASTTDVLLLESTGAAYAWTGAYPVGGYDVAPGVDPTVVAGFQAKSGDNLRAQIADVGGLSLVGVATYAQIRAYSGTATRIRCSGRVNLFDGAHGDFVADPSDTTSADNDGTILVDANGMRWKRVFDDPGVYRIEWFGGVGDGVTLNDVPMQKMMAAAALTSKNIKFSTGDYCLSAEYFFDEAWTISGNGRYKTTLRLKNNDVDLIRLGWFNTLRGMSMRSDVASGAKGLLKLYDIVNSRIPTEWANATIGGLSYYNHLEELDIQGGQNYNVYGINLAYTSIHNVRTGAAKGSFGVRFEGKGGSGNPDCTTIWMSGSNTFQSTLGSNGDGLQMHNVVDSRIKGTCEGNKGRGCTVTGTSFRDNIVDLYLENNYLGAGSAGDGDMVIASTDASDNSLKLRCDAGNTTKGFVVSASAVSRGNRLSVSYNTNKYANASAAVTLQTGWQLDADETYRQDTNSEPSRRLGGKFWAKNCLAASPYPLTKNAVFKNWTTTTQPTDWTVVTGTITQNTTQSVFGSGSRGIFGTYPSVMSQDVKSRLHKSSGNYILSVVAKSGSTITASSAGYSAPHRSRVVITKTDTSTMTLDIPELVFNSTDWEAKEVDLRVLASPSDLPALSAISKFEIFLVMTANAAIGQCGIYDASATHFEPLNPNG